MKEIQLNLTDERIAHMSKEEFRKQIKIRVEKTAINYFKKLQSSHSKTSKLVCDGFNPAEYLHSPYLNKEEVQQLFKLRNHMIDVKQNFSSIYKENMWCRTCYLFQESQEHLLKCSVIVDRLKQSINFSTAKYCMLFKSEEEQIKITKVFSLVLKTRKSIIEETRKSP